MIFAAREDIAALTAILRDAEPGKDILRLLRQTDSRLFLGAGVVRAAVWDRLHGYAASAPPRDVDVVYFEAAAADPISEREIERRLRAERRSLPWEVRNQARFRPEGRETTYRSMEEAIAHWPERCTAVAVRLRADDALDVVAPWGLFDLFGLRVRPTPFFESRKDVVARRAAEKNWRVRWPKLVLDLA